MSDRSDVSEDEMPAPSNSPKRKYPKRTSRNPHPLYSFGVSPRSLSNLTACLSKCHNTGAVATNAVTGPQFRRAVSAEKPNEMLVHEDKQRYDLRPQHEKLEISAEKHSKLLSGIQSCQLRRKARRRTVKRVQTMLELLKFRENFGTCFASSLSPKSVVTSWRPPGELLLRSVRSWDQCAVDFGTVNKIFTSTWLNEDQILCGTKCNQLLCLDVNSHRIVKVDTIGPTYEPSASSSFLSSPSQSNSGQTSDNVLMVATNQINTASPHSSTSPASPGNGGSSSNASSLSNSPSSRISNSRNFSQAMEVGGVHALAINPSRTLLATGATQSHHLAIYRLPDISPVAVGIEGHLDWIFDGIWINDQIVASGGRDGHLCLWDVNERVLEAAYQNEKEIAEQIDQFHSSESPFLAHRQPYVDMRHSKVFMRDVTTPSLTTSKLRSLSLSKSPNEIAALTLNSTVFLYDITTGAETHFVDLDLEENVCLAFNAEANFLAVGAKSGVTLLDPRSLKTIKTIPMPSANSGVRSLSFNRSIMTIGTSDGGLMFACPSAMRFLAPRHQPQIMSRGPNAPRFSAQDVMLKSPPGWLRQDEQYRTILPYLTTSLCHAVFTHCYDPVNLRLFSAGGPLPSGLYGNCAALWN